ncbi:uncharacterized protein [Euphorbia lathyris]|uniref:uncharacterized protein n=1 Tax=Euphorbia lathyris TaxID=212925 RepID=UPI0033135227
MMSSYMSFTQFLTFRLIIVGLYPKGSPSRNSPRPKVNLGQGGGLEIVFNQQLTRLG